MERAEQSLRLIVDNVAEGLITIDETGLIESFNASAERMFGYSAEEVIGRNVSLLMPNPHRDAHDGYIKRYLETGQARVIGSRSEVVARHKDGSDVPVELAIGEIRAGGTVRFVGTVSDISDRKRTEATLRASEENFRELIEGALHGVLVHRDGKPLFVNQALADNLGYEGLDEIMALESIESFYVPEERARLRGYRDARLAGEEVPDTYEFRALRKDGTEVWLQTSVRIVIWHGEPAIQHWYTDLTERRQAAQATRTAQQRLNDAIESLPVSFALFDADDRLVVCNGNTHDLLGWNPDLTVPGARFEDLLRDVVDRGQLADAIGREEEWIQSHMKRHRAANEPSETRRADGRWVYAVEQKTSDGGTIAVRIDITERKQAEQLAFENETRFRAIMENVVDGIIMIDETGTIELLNPAAENIFGCAADELIGRNVRILMPQSIGKHHDGYLGRFLDTGEAKIIGIGREVEGQRKDGSTVPLDLAIGEMSFGGHRKFIGILRDITERKTAEQKLHTVIENLQEGFGLYDADDRLLICNDEYRRPHYPAKDILKPGMRFEDLMRVHIEAGSIADVEGDVEDILAERMEMHRNPKGQYIRELDDGTSYVIKEARTADGGYFVTQTDITELKRAEKVLERHAKELERSNADLEQFAYIASHDLQEPLRKVQAFGDRLQSKYGETLGEQGRDYIERMQSATNRMQTLITDLLKFSRVNSKGKPFKPVDLGSVVDEVVEDLELQIRETKADIKVADLPSIEADPLQMRQLLQNMIGNALKYRRDDVTPVVEVDAGLVKNGSDQEMCKIVVKDNGIGFDAKHSERIFGIFQRLHGRGQYEGTGVGLALCRKIAERHGGTISAIGRGGEGAIFIVTLPTRLPNSEAKRNV
ncbi:MAG: PAS domain S-box protein [Alphaproteobacteria bacterium]|nr:PAS domain S-box protein [Alphaproteobacteria bacterium]